MHFRTPSQLSADTATEAECRRLIETDCQSKGVDNITVLGTYRVTGNEGVVFRINNRSNSDCDMWFSFNLPHDLWALQVGVTEPDEWVQQFRTP